MNRILMAVGTLLILIIVGILGYKALSSNNSWEIGTLDTSYLISQKAKKLALDQKPVSPQQLAYLSDSLKEKVAQWSEKNRIILLSKGAVWGGNLKDYTSDILEELGLEDKTPWHS